MNKKILFFWGLLVFLIAVSIITNEYSNSGNSEGRTAKNDIIEEDNNYFKLDSPKKAAYTHYREWIHIDGSDPNNWSDTADAYEWCYVENNYYIIENVTIDATNSPLRDGILIENSIDDYFIIQNCIIANSSASYLYGAITLRNTNNGTIIDNKLIDNQNGIVLDIASNNTIINNTIESKEYGIFIRGGFPPFFACYNNNISNNNMSNCGIMIRGTLAELISNTIDSSNTVSQKSVYYYVNESGLMPINFTNAGQIMLYYCSNSDIFDVDTSNSSDGIYIIEGFNITISHSNITHNNFNGLYISASENITIDNCRIIENGRYGILLEHSNYCNISLNYYECNSIGIYLSSSYNNTFKNNTMVRTGVFFADSKAPMPNYFIDTSNTVNGKPIYHYRDKNYLTSANFSNPGQIILVNCNNSIISNFDISNGSYGILVYFSNNVTLSHFNISSHKKSGIYIRKSNNITISYTNVKDCDTGVGFYKGKDNTISNNTFSHNDENGLYIMDFFNSLLFNNTIKNNGDIGLYLADCQYLNITKSVISNNSEAGIYVSSSSNITINYTIITKNKDGLSLYYGFDCIITMNTILNNSREGINIGDSDDNIISMNDIINNSRYGIYISNDHAENNLIFNNTFITNGVQNAYDAYGNNFWYNDTLGNSWDDYVGDDANDNGRGDTPYIINAIPLSQDRYPIYWDAPTLFIALPFSYQLCGNNSPAYLVVIVDGIEDTIWYNLGNDPTMYNITGDTSGDINQTGWVKLDNGTVIIHFYVNDSRGYIGYDPVSVFKDCIAPYITIIEPEYNKLFNATAPFYNLTFIEAHLDDTWYRLWNGTEWSINYTISGIGSKRTGQISQDAWNNCPNGTVIIEFYANDTLGNLRRNSTSIRKDILAPIITINDPTPNELFSSTAPGLADCNVLFSDGSVIAAQWHMLINGTDNTDYTNNYTWNDEVNQTAWNQMGNGTVIIRIFANDSLGNIGRAEVIVRKDIEPPTIVITKPALNDIFGNNTMNFTISVSGRNLDTILYMLINETNSNDYTNNVTYSDSVITGTYEDTIQYYLWNQFENGTVIIRFFLNRTIGLIAIDEVIVRKDIISPEITIIEPEYNDLYNATAPSYNLILIETHLDDIWYRLWNGTHWSINYTVGGAGSQRAGQINQEAWNDCPNGTVIIEFYANDTTDNIGMNSTTIRKDIFGPQITIINPVPNALFSIEAPDNTECNILFEDGSGIATRWYMLIDATDSNHYTDNYTWDGEVNQTAWNQMGNGTVIIRIFANDSLDNIGIAEVIVRKDIIFPNIVINDPTLNDIFGENAFNFTITVSGKNLNTIWYMLINGTNSNDYTNNLTYSKSVTAGSIEDTINYNLWNQFENGKVIIRFFLNRTNGVMAFDEVLVRKDLIAPNITIIEPIANQSVYSSPADFIIVVTETNPDTMWYRLFNGTHYTNNYTFSVNTTINGEDWDKMLNSIGDNFTIIFYCNDTAGNIGFANVTVIKSDVMEMCAIIPLVHRDADDNGKKSKEEPNIVVPVLIGIGVSGGIAAVAIIYFKKIRKPYY